MSYEEQNFRKIYEYIDCSKNTEGIEEDGKENFMLLPDFGAMCTVLAESEQLVRDIALGEKVVGFKIKRNARNLPEISASPLDRDRFASMMELFRGHSSDDRYIFSPYVEVQREAFNALGLDPETFPLGYSPKDGVTRKLPAEWFNDVCAKIVEIVATPRFRENVRVRGRNAERNYERGLKVERRVFERKPRQQALMLHLGYQRRYRSQSTLDGIKQDREKFLNNWRSNELLRGNVDYIWTIERGDDSGWHLHMLIFYCADSRRDVKIAKWIGEYWAKVTGGKGHCWNSNAQMCFHEKHGHGIGLGEIGRDDAAKREALREYIHYMTAVDQLLRIKCTDGSHLFGTSQPKRKKGLGVP